MKKKLFLLLPLLLLTGCATSVCRHYAAAPGQVDSSGEAVVAELKGQNYGYFLFYGIPLWCGHGYRANEGEWDLWRNMVRPRDMRGMLSLRARHLGASGISDVKITERSSGFWSLWIIWRRSVEGQAFAVGKKSR
ncbi:MAG: hypothetical protein IKC65_02585 [Lentisphaeria bacterium]|nr:hypothetical protein [Lentisphaeria bacterium]